MDKTHLLTTIEGLEELYGFPGETSLAKETSTLSPEYRRWIETSPFFALASVGPEGLDCSPRGDEKGHLFKILTEKTLAIPDRRGNNRLDTLRNIIRNPQVALLFFIPGINETLRINGMAKITTDPNLLSDFSIKGTLPKSAMIVDIKSIYFQCARALIRSQLWDPNEYQTKAHIPTAGQMTKSVRSEFDAISYDQELPGRQKTTLY